MAAIEQKTTIPINPNPKARVLLDPRLVRFHNETITNPMMDQLLDLTLLYHAYRENITADPAHADASYWKLRGAHDFVELLKTIGIRTLTREAEVLGTLNHQV